MLYKVRGRPATLSEAERSYQYDDPVSLSMMLNVRVSISQNPVSSAYCKGHQMDDHSNDTAQASGKDLRRSLSEFAMS